MGEVYTLPRKTAAQKAAVQSMADAAVHYLDMSERRAEAEQEAANLYDRLRREAEDSLSKLLAQIKHVETGRAEAKAIANNAMVRIFGCSNS